MKKVIRVAVLSAMSTAAVLAPLGTTLADMTSFHSEYVTREMDRMQKKMDNSMRRITAENRFPSHSFNIRSDDYSSRSILSKHHPFYSSDNQHHHHVDHKRREKKHHHVERKTYHYVERKTTTHNHIHEHHVNHNNSGDALAAGILGLAAGAFLGNVLKQPEQPQIVYQAAPQNHVVYQQVPQSHVVYEIQSETIYQPWTADWLKYCKTRYRSFNHKTGTFRGYDGLDHFCYAPVR
ncbi:BA14K family protein [Bartonella sp. B23]